ncbi:MAG: TonB-dependent receptor [Bacteroides sp.]|nr:TonB-dependent receptor [Bacteroides sp.]
MKQVNFRIYRMILPLLLWLFLSVGVYAQQITVKGHVKDATGEPVIGANVVEVANTSNGTITDLDGNFTLNVPKGAKISVSFIGYTTQEVKATPLMNVTLQDDSQLLDAVVVIGYGTVKKDDLTGSVSTVKADQINKGVITSPADLLRGKSAGVVITSGSGQPGSASTIRIRGGSSLSATNDPLIVVDGLPISNESISGMGDPLSSINPNDIESFTVLKDASATAIYGSRASNGVIVITTKKGAKGGSSLPRIDLDFSASLSQVPQYVDVMDADLLRLAVAAHSGKDSDAYAALGDENTDWQKEIYQLAQTYEANLSLNGQVGLGEAGSLPYRVSGGFLSQEGVLKRSKMNRGTVSLNLTPQLLDKHLTINMNAKGVYTDNTFANQDAIGAAIHMDPTQPVYDNSLAGTGNHGYYMWRDLTGNCNTMATMNPVALLDERDDMSTAKRFIGNAQLDYKFHGFEDLRFNMNVGLDFSKSNGHVDTPEGSEQSLHSTLESGSGYHSDYDFMRRDQTLETYFNYNHAFGDHHVDAMAGYSWQHFYTSSNSLAVKQNDRTQKLSESISRTEYYLVSFFGRANYTYSDKYMFTFTVRRDGTSRFQNNKWGLFPSVALGWNIANESFLKDNKVLSNLKLRLSWGQTGQQDLNAGNYPTLATYYTNLLGSQYYFGDKLITPITALGYNADLKWETTTTWNAGLDYGFLNGRISGGIDFYYRKTEDLINYTPVSALSNLTNYLTSNIGDLENTGIEFEINAIPVQTKDWNWIIGANVAWNKNKITKLTAVESDSSGVETGGISGGTGNNIQMHQVGYPTSSFYVYEQIYDKNGKPIEGAYVDRNKDGKINSDDKYFAHKPAPDVTMGFNTTLSYQNWTLAASAHANIGNWVYDNVSSDNEMWADLWTNNFVSNRMNSAVHTNFEQAQYLSDYYLHNASFFKLDNVTLGYTFKDLVKAKDRTMNLNLYFTVQNVCTISKYKGLDPEIFDGIDNNIYPRPRTFILGVKFDF